MTDKRDILDAKGPGASLGDLLKQLQRKIELDIRVAAPATTVSYNSATQRATVELGFIPVEAADSGESVLEKPLKLYNVPVSFPRSSSGYLALPMSSSGGDTGLLVFTDRALTNWLRSGKATDPISARTHNLADGVFFPGITTDAAPLTSVSHAVPGTIVIEGTKVHLGDTASAESVIKGTTYIAAENTLDAALTAWWTAFQAAAAPLLAAPDPSGALLWTFMNALAAPTVTLLAALGVHQSITTAPASTILSTKVKVDA